MGRRVGLTGHGGGDGEGRQHLCQRVAQASATNRARGVGERQRRPYEEVAFGGVAVGQLDDGL